MQGCFELAVLPREALRAALGFVLEPRCGWGNHVRHTMRTPEKDVYKDKLAFSRVTSRFFLGLDVTASVVIRWRDHEPSSDYIAQLLTETGCPDSLEGCLPTEDLVRP